MFFASLLRNYSKEEIQIFVSNFNLARISMIRFPSKLLVAVWLLEKGAKLIIDFG